MNWKEQGGAAFPFAATDPSNVELQSSGMSLRDYFAGQALTGDLSNSEGGIYQNDVDEKYLVTRARLYYRIADALVAARHAK